MSSIRAQPTVESLFSGEIAADRLAAFRHLKALLASIFRRWLCAQQHAVAGYDGCGRCAESRLLDEIATSQARRAII
jgi:hypothetical protein